MTLKDPPWGEDPIIDWDDDILEKFWVHRIRDFEIEQCFENKYRVIPHKQYEDRFVIEGVTDGGRSLLIIVQYKGGNVIRPITGWDR